MKKKLLVIFIAILGLFILIILFNFFKNNIDQNKPTGSYQETRKIYTLPETTGADLSPDSFQELTPADAALEQFYKLMDNPVTNTDFTLKPNYDKNIITVHFYQPNQNNMPIFLNWLKTNGYDQIPDTKFEFE